MSAALILQLLAMFGPSAVQLVTALITQIENNQPVTSAQWATLAASLQQSSQSRMQAVLTANGIDHGSKLAQDLLTLAK